MVCHLVSLLELIDDVSKVSDRRAPCDDFPKVEVVFDLEQVVQKFEEVAANVRERTRIYVD
jgi:hypothetical protein